MPSSSVVIATRRRPQALSRCLSALASLTPGAEEVIVVDNSAGDEETRRVAEASETAYLVEPVKGLSRARNRGARHARGDVVAFIDDDAVAEPSWLGSLLRPFADPTVAAVTGRVAPLEATSDAHRRSVDSGWIEFGPTPRRIDLSHPQWFEISNFGGLGIGTNMAVRRIAFDTWPGFRESIGRGTPIPGCEEHHAFFELLRRGHAVAYEPEAVVGHPHPATMDGVVERHRQAVTETFAYATLLLVEEPGYRGRTLRYLGRRIAGQGQPWVERPGARTEPLLSRKEMARAAGHGPLLYARSRWARRRT